MVVNFVVVAVAIVFLFAGCFVSWPKVPQKKQVAENATLLDVAQILTSSNCHLCFPFAIPILT